MTIEDPRRGLRRAASSGPLALLACAALLGGPARAAAQYPVGHRVLPGGEHPPGITAITPHSAAVGQAVHIRSALLPPHTEVQVILGALRSDFEVVATGITDGDGRLMGADSIQIRVPEWVQRDRSYLLILTDLQYHPLAVTDLFHPTDANGLLTRKGTIQRERTPCLAMTNDAGELYFLTGDVGWLQAGERVAVEGRVLEESGCGSGTTIQVVKLGRLPAR